MRTLVTLAFIAISLTINAQQSHFYQVGEHQFEVLHTKVDDCWGGSIPSDKLFYLNNGTKQELVLDGSYNFRGMIAQIHELSYSIEDGLFKLMVRHGPIIVDKSGGQASKTSTFYLIEGSWKRIAA